MRKNIHYILGADGKPKHEKSVLKWGRWFETADRVVKQTKIGTKYMVSTVFLGLDWRFYGKGKPLLWETMVFKAMTRTEAARENKLNEKAWRAIKKQKACTIV